VLNLKKEADVQLSSVLSLTECVVSRKVRWKSDRPARLFSVQVYHQPTNMAVSAATSVLTL
jgi:hypothetical protein